MARGGAKRSQDRQLTPNQPLRVIEPMEDPVDREVLRDPPQSLRPEGLLVAEHTIDRLPLQSKFRVVLDGVDVERRAAVPVLVADVRRVPERADPTGGGISTHAVSVDEQRVTLLHPLQVPPVSLPRPLLGVRPNVPDSRLVRELGRFVGSVGEVDGLREGLLERALVGRDEPELRDKEICAIYDNNAISFQQTL